MEKIGLEAILDNSQFLRGADQYNSALGDMEKKTDEGGSRMGAAFSTMGKVALGGIGIVVGAVAAIGTAALSAATSLDDAYDSMTVATGATGEKLDGMKEDFRAVFGSIPTSAADAGDAIAVLSQRLDVAGPPLQEISRLVLEMSRLTGGDAKANASAFADVMARWEVPVGGAAVTMNDLFRASQMSGVGVSELMGQVSLGATSFQALGFDILDATALLAGFGKAGIAPTTVLTGLKTGMAKLAETGLPLRESFDQLIKSIQGATTEEEALTMAVDVFGARAGGEMVAAIRSGKFNLDEMSQSIRANEDSIMSASRETADFGEKFTILKNKAVLALEPLGMSIMDLMTKIGVWLIPVVDRLVRMVSEQLKPIFDALPGVISGVISGFETLGNAFGGISSRLSAIPGLFAAFVSIVRQNAIPILAGLATIIFTVVIPALSAWFAASSAAAAGTIAALAPVIVPIIAVAAAVALLKKGWDTNFGGMRDTLTGLWTSTLQPIFSQVKAWFIEGLPGALASLQERWAAVWTTVQAIIDMAWRKIDQIIRAVIDTAGPYITQWMNEAKVLFETYWPIIQQTVQEAMEIIQDVVTVTLNVLRVVISTVLGAIQAFWSDHGQQVMAIVGTIWEQVKLIITTAINIVAGVIHTVLDLIHGDWAGAWEAIKGVGEAIWNLIGGTIQNFADLVRGIFLLLWDTVDGYFEAAWANSIRIVTGMWTDITTWVGKIRDDVKSFFLDMWNSVTGFFETAWTNLVGIATSIYTDITKWVSDTVQSVKDFFGGLPGELANIGNQIIGGLLGGLQNKWNEVIGWIQGAIANLVGTVRGALDIFSPSGVFREIGHQTMEGFIVGMDDQKTAMLAKTEMLFEAEGKAAMFAAQKAAPDAKRAGATLRDAMLEGMSGKRGGPTPGATQMDTGADALLPQLRAFLDSIERVFAAYDSTWLQKVVPWFQDAADVVNAAAGTADAMEAVGNYGGRLDFQQLHWFINNLGSFLEVLTQKFAAYNQEGGFLTKLAAWFPRISALAEPIDAVATAMQRIGDYAGRFDFLHLHWFVNNLVSWLEVLGNAIAGYGPAYLSVIEQWFARISVVAGPIQAAGDAMQAIGKYAGEFSFRQVHWFVNNLVVFLETLTQAVGGYGPMFLSAMEQWWGRLSTIAGPIKAAADALQAIGAYAGKFDAKRVTWFLNDLEYFLRSLSEHFREYGVSWFSALVQWWSRIATIAEPIKAGADALQAVGAYAGRFDAKRAEWFLGDLEYFLRSLSLHFREYGPSWFSALVQWWERIAAIASPIKAGADALQAVGAYAGRFDAKRAEWFLGDLEYFLRSLSAHFREYGPAWFSALVDWWERIANIASPIKAGADALQAVGAYAGKFDAKRAEWFLGDLEYFLRSLSQHFREYGAGWFSGVVGWWERITTLASPIKAAADALQAIGAYAGKFDAKRAQWFLGDLEYFLRSLSEHFREYGANWFSGMVQWWERISALTGPIKGAVDALRDIGTYSGRFDATHLQWFLDNLEAFLRATSEHFREYGAGWFAVMVQWWDRISTLTGPIRGAVEAIMSIGDFVAVSRAKIDKFVANLKAFLLSVRDAFKDFGGGWLTDIAAIFERAGTILGTAKTGLEALAALADFGTEFITPRKIDVFIDIMLYMLNSYAWLAQVVGPYLNAVGTVFATQAQATFAMFQTALDFLGGLAEAALPTQSRIDQFVGILRGMAAAMGTAVGVSAEALNSATTARANVEAAVGILSGNAPSRGGRGGQLEGGNGLPQGGGPGRGGMGGQTVESIADAFNRAMQNIDWGGIIGRPTYGGGGGGGGGGGESFFTADTWADFWTIFKAMAWDLGTLVMLNGGAAQGRRVVSYAEAGTLQGYQVGAGQGTVYQLNVTTLTARESVIADFNLMQALAGR